MSFCIFRLKKWAGHLYGYRIVYLDVCAHVRYPLMTSDAEVAGKSDFT